MTPEGVLNFIKAGGLPAILILILFGVLVGLIRQWYVPGWVYRELKANLEKVEGDRNRAWEIARTNLAIAERGTQVVERVVERAEDTPSKQDVERAKLLAELDVRRLFREELKNVLGGEKSSG